MSVKNSRKVPSLNMTTDSVILAMRAFIKTPAFEIVYGLQHRNHIKILDEGKRSGKPELWAKLDGHDLAMNEPLVWANKKTREEREESGGNEDGE